jgi:hypothetical protein
MTAGPVVNPADVDFGAAPFSMSAATYIEQMRHVSGWLAREDAEMMHAVLLAQNALAVKGDLCEIGVYCGKSLALLAIMANKGEWAHGFDLFPPFQDASDDTREKTLALLRYVGVESCTRLYACDSQNVVMPQCRFLHVDGAHDTVSAYRDMCQAKESLVEFGVLCVDDFCDVAFPGVAEAVGLFMGASQFRPFACSRNKLFLARTPRARSLLQSHIPERGFVRSS